MYLAVKENQERLYKALQETFLKAEANQFNAMTYSQHETVEGDHGRIETRRARFPWIEEGQLNLLNNTLIYSLYS